MAKHTVDFQPLGYRAKCSSEDTILNCARNAGIGINTICGGAGTCQSCRIQIISGDASKPTAREQKLFSRDNLKNGWRLACQTYLLSNCRVFIPPESMTSLQRLQIEGLEYTVVPEPVVKIYPVRIPEPSISDLRADADRLIESLNKQHHLRCRRIDFSLLRTVSSQLREKQWVIQAAVRGDEIISISNPGSLYLGLAIDIGTTKIAGYLVDLHNGNTLLSKGIMNPQISYGEDVISRITVSIKSEEDSGRLQSLLIDSINQMVEEMCLEIGASPDNIVDAVAVGNTVMHHLFLGLSVKQLAVAPFVPSVSSGLDVKASQLGLKFASGAYIHLLPNIAGFVGADHVADLLAIKALETDATTLLIDIGTNTEISLIKNGRITAVCCASGPAFEGGHIKHGMRAASGAIERVKITGDALHLLTVNNTPPIGICGSGVLDAMAQLYLSGLIDKGGRLKDKHPGIRIRHGQREYVLIEKQGKRPEIVFTQRDIRELQLAKAAIRSGIQALLNANNCTEEQIEKIIIAGAFGNYIDISSAIDIGMLPALPLKRFQQVGNAAGVGARFALISSSQRTLAQKIAGKVHYLELANTPDYTQLFLQASYLGKYRLVQTSREEIK